MQKWLLRVIQASMLCFSLQALSAQTTFKTGELAGRKVGDLFHLYLFGAKGTATIPATLSVDFTDNLENAWGIKHGRGSSGVAKTTGKRIVEMYRVQSTSFEQYLGGSRREIQVVKGHLDWKCVAKAKRLKPLEAKVLEEVAMALNEKDLAAYAMTELLPGIDGKFNLAYFKLLLRAAGEDYVHSLPAVFDGKTSFGEYQFTEFALFDIPIIGKRGASIINACLEAYRVPGSVAHLRGGAHHRAAYLLAINSLADWIGKLNVKELARVSLRASSQQSDIVQFIANAHHQTSRAPMQAKTWVVRGMQTPYWLHGARGKRLKEYAQKTAANRSALFSEARPQKRRK